MEQDDTAENFVGAGPKGKHPNIICARLQTPLTVAQLTQALDLYHRQEASLQSDPSTPSPFFFFDFDGTLTLADGLLQVDTGSGSLEQLFGNAERRRTLQLTLSTLLQAGRCYVLTANGMAWRMLPTRRGHPTHAYGPLLDARAWHALQSQKARVR